MKVAVIESDGHIVARGEWDGKRIDGEYARVNGVLYHCAYVFLDDYADEIHETLTRNHLKVKEAEDFKMKALMEIGNKYRAR